MTNPHHDDVARRALHIAQALAVSGSKDKAETRRMTDAGSTLFWRLAARLDISPSEEPRWLLFTRLAAILTPSSATESFHDAQRPLGAVLADGGLPGVLDTPVVSEARLARLLAARGSLRATALERCVRSISRNTRQLDAVSLAWAIMNPDGRSIARDYYRRLDQVAKNTKD